MKSLKLIAGIFTIVLSVSACRNNSQTTNETDSAAMSDHPAGERSTEDAMKNAMDKMMKEMHQLTMTGNVDYDFAMMMKIHHQGAVDMAQAELDAGRDEKLKEMAQKIKEGQSAEINEFQSYLDSHRDPEKNYDPGNRDAGFGKDLKENMDLMMTMPVTAQHPTPDKQFVHMMVPHLESAIDMAERYIKNGKNQDLIALAKKIISEGKSEIDQLKQLDQGG